MKDKSYTTVRSQAKYWYGIDLQVTISPMVFLNYIKYVKTKGNTLLFGIGLLLIFLL